MQKYIPARVEMALLWGAMGLIPCVILAATVSPWSTAKSALESYGRGPYIPVSASYRYRAWDSGSTEIKTRSYVVLGAALGSLSIYEVSSLNGVVSVEEAPYGLVWTILGYASLYAGFIWRLRVLAHQHAAA